MVDYLFWKFLVTSVNVQCILVHYLQYLFCPSLQVKHIHACNKHFDDTQYNQTQLRMHAMGLRSKPPQLLPDAVPHIFSPGPSPSPTCSPSTRHQASYSRKMVGNVCCIINLIYPSVLRSINNCSYCWCWWCEYCRKDNHIQFCMQGSLDPSH